LDGNLREVFPAFYIPRESRQTFPEPAREGGAGNGDCYRKGNSSLELIEAGDCIVDREALYA